MVRASAIHAIWGMMVLSGTGACTAGDRYEHSTGVLVVLRSNLEPGEELERIDIETRRRGGTPRRASLVLARDDDAPGVRLPASFAVYAEAEDLQEGVMLEVSGYGPRDVAPRVRRRAELHFKSRKMLRLVLDLARACVSRFRDCEMQGSTCSGDGRCVELAIEADTLERVGPGEETRALPVFPDPWRDRDLDETEASEPMGAMPAEAGEGNEGGASQPVEAGASLPDECEHTGAVCKGDQLQTCVDGELIDAVDCEHGCVDGATQCNACSEGERSCSDGVLRTCTDGQATEEPCPLGCTLDTSACIPCREALPMCGSDGELLTCQGEATWVAEACYASCVVGGAGTGARCAGCVPGDAICNGRDVVTCGSRGEAIGRGCSFSCREDLRCGEDTALGQALISLTID